VGLEVTIDSGKMKSDRVRYQMLEAQGTTEMCGISTNMNIKTCQYLYKLFESPADPCQHIADTRLGCTPGQGIGRGVATYESIELDA
jgi:hypothetical protein